MIEIGSRLRGHDVVELCNRLMRDGPAPQRIFVDNGGEFSGHLMDLWAYHHRVQIDLSRPGKPTHKCFGCRSLGIEATSHRTVSVCFVVSPDIKQPTLTPIEHQVCI
mgnify:CR=1 FL=1